MDRGWRESNIRGSGDAPALFELGFGSLPNEGTAADIQTRRSGDNLRMDRCRLDATSI